MTIADKLLYLDETKDLLADAINSYTQVITPDTPFREYAQWIDNIVFSAEGGIPSLFDGEAGFLWGDLPYYQDPAGTTEATWGDPVGLIPDASGNGADFTQATVTARPVLGRVPKGERRNLDTNTDSTPPSSGVEVVGGYTAPNGIEMSTLATDGSSSYPLIRSSTEYRTRLGTGDRGCASFYYAPGESDGLWLRIGGPAGGERLARYTIINGIPEFAGFSGTTAGMSTVTSYAEAVAENLYRFVTVVDITEDNVLLSSCQSITLGEATAMDDAGSFGGFQLEKIHGDSISPTPYQAVTDEFDITEANIPSIHYLHFDGTDDLVSTTLPAITDGTLVIAGTNGIWIDDEFNFEGGAFEIGPTSYTNGPEGIMPVLGDLIVGGTFVIDRQLTSDERAKVVRKMKSMGAPGVLP